MRLFNLQYTLLLLILPEIGSTPFLGFSFTIHFATINTYSSRFLYLTIIEFTIHFATINTKAGGIK